MPVIERDTGSYRWEDSEYFLTQEFLFHAPRAALDTAEIVREADALVNQRTRAATFGIARWAGDRLMLGPLCIVEFGPLRSHYIAGFDAAADRAIRGGLIAREPGGAMWYRVRMDGPDLLIATGLSGFSPRLPRLIFDAVQLPLHRATIRRAMRDLADRLDRRGVP